MTNLRDVRFPNEYLDAFARLRVGSPVLLLESKQVGGVTTSLFSTQAGVGSGVVSYSLNKSSTSLTVGPAAGKATRQTKSRAVYQTGKSLRLLQTFTMAPGQANLEQRCGYFDDNNGVFFKEENGELSVVIRSSTSGSVVNTEVSQANWNIDKLDGTGKSGITLDLSKSQILAIDLEWLAVGTVAFGFFIDRELHYCHFVQNANTTVGAYMQNPNLPIRWEIEAVAGITGSATLESICGTVDSEGGYELIGVSASADRGLVERTIPGRAIQEILSIRMQSSYTEFATAFVQFLSAISTSSGDFLYRLVLNPTETVAGAWTPIANSIMEYNTTREVTPGTGFLISSGVVSSDVDSVNIEDRPLLTFGTDLAGVTDVFSLQIGVQGSGPEAFLGSLSWREVY